MTVQIKKKFDSLEKGIENMLDAAAHDMETISISISLAKIFVMSSFIV